MRPLLSLPPLKPPIMDDIIPMNLLPQKKLLPSIISHPIISGIKNNEESLLVPTTPKPIVVVDPQTNNQATTDEKQLPDKTECAVKETGGQPPSTKELNPDGIVPDKEEGAEGEEDALSEISDDADEILNRQEVKKIFYCKYIYKEIFTRKLK